MAFVVVEVRLPDRAQGTLHPLDGLLRDADEHISETRAGRGFEVPVVVDDALYGIFQQGLLGGPPAVDRRPADTGARSDYIEREIVEALLRRKLDRGVEDR